jgi:DNA-binding MarR family transcriptional regulator
MTQRRTPSPPSRDPLSLAHAPLTELIAALESQETLTEADSGLPPRANQIARLIAAEAVRLIRLGSQTEIVEAADDLAQTMIGAAAASIERDYPDAHRIVTGAAVALDTASAPASSGAEQTVLRSWKGKAMEIAALLNGAPGRAMRRSDLLDQLPFGQAAESAMSHILTSMEAAGLIVRVRHGRNVMVHLGPTGREDHVQAELATYETLCTQRTAEERFQLVRETLEALLERHLETFVSDSTDGVSGFDELLSQVQTQRLFTPGASVSVRPASSDDEVMCQVQTGDASGLLCKVRLDGDELVGVQTYPSADERHVSLTSQKVVGPSLLRFESTAFDGKRTQIRSKPRGQDNLHDASLTGDDGSARISFRPLAAA